MTIKAEHVEAAREALAMMTKASRVVSDLASAHDGPTAIELQQIEEILDELRHRMFKLL